MEIRRLDREEINDALNLVREVFLSDPDLIRSQEGISSFMSFVKDQGPGLCWLGAYDGDLCGALGYDDEYHIALFFVRKEKQKQGIGRDLLKVLCEEAEHAGYARISVNAAEKAKPVYEHLGFTAADDVQEKDGIRYIPMEIFLQRKYLGKTVTVTVDRPYGSFHPTFADIRYLCNYGYVEEILASDGEFQDAYVFGPEEALESFTGTVIAVIIRRDDTESKWVVAKDTNYERQAVIDAVGFQEQFFDTHILWLEN